MSAGACPQFAMAQLDALVWDSWLALARHPRYADAFDLPGFAYYGALVTARGQLLPYPAGEAPGPLGYLRQALEHIAAAQNAGMRIKGVTLWTGIDNYE